MGRKIFYNGDYLDESMAKVSIYDSALMFGDTVFEMTRSFNREHFRLEEHIDRLIASANYLSINMSMSKHEIIEACNTVSTMNEPVFDDADEHRLMINVTRGLLSIYSPHVGVPDGPNIIIADFPLKWTVKGMGHLFSKGVNLTIPAQRIIPADLLEPKVKNRSRIHYLMANIQVSRVKGRDNWALMLDPDGYISEGTGSNFFLVKDSVLFTPEPRNILRGISRDFVIELARETGYEVVEKNLEPYDLMTADEAFMTATPFCILPACRFEGRDIGLGGPGPITKNLLALWGDKVGVCISTQIEMWDKEEGIPQVSGVSPYKFGKS